MNQYVQHISGQGEKWEVRDGVTSSHQWCVKAYGEIGYHWLPKSEYRICEPPEVWEDCTEECTVNGLGSIQHNGVNTMVEQGYRRRKVHVSIEKGTENWVDGWAVIIEKKVSQ